ncbi:hypothetical protein BJV82DRAFT_583114 [Fennellomyces sp. T-0311]|nr:hypothetical protein BJV82DRAFT_583114 [Fennellomyces sp. T-0311]
MDTSFQALKEHSHELEPGATDIYASYRRRNRTGATQAFGTESKEGAELKAKVIPQLLYTRSKLAYKDAVKKFEEMAELADNKEVGLKSYLNGLRDNEEMWAGPWPEKYAHFGARTSQRAEGTHAGIKHILKQPSVIVNLFEKLHIYLDAQDKNASFEYSREKGLNWIVHDPVAKQAILMLEKNNICHYAIRKTISEISEASRIPGGPVFDTITGLIVDPEQSRINQQYGALRIRLDQMISGCETSQQKADLLKSLDDAMDRFTPVKLQKFVLPAPVIPKGRPPKAIGLRNRSLRDTINEGEVADQEKKRKREPKAESTADKSKQAIDKTFKKAKKQIGNNNEDLFGTKNKPQPVPSNNGKGIPMENTSQSSGSSPYPYQYWFHSSTDALLAVSTFWRPIVIYNDCQDNSSYGFDDCLYLPHHMPLNKVGTLPAVMVFDQGASHYEALKMKTSTKVDWPKKHQGAWETLKDKKGLSDYVATWTYLKKVKKAKTTEPLLARLLHMDIVEIADEDNIEALDPDIVDALKTAIDEASDSESETNAEDELTAIEVLVTSSTYGTYMFES